MHEMSIADSLIEQVLEIAAENNAVVVKSVEIDAGILRGIIPEVMQNAWSSVTVDSIADGSKLIINQIPAVAKCRECKTEFAPEEDCFLCPNCQLADVDIINGDDILLKSIDMATENSQQKTDNKDDGEL